MRQVEGWAALALALVACGAAPPPPPPPASLPPPPPPAAPPAPPPHEISAPPLALNFIDAPTAQVFQIVDALSRWYPRANREYAEWASKEMPIDEGERAMLALHAKLRAKRRWGALDQAFNVGSSIGDAARAAVEKKLLTVPDAENERVLLQHFEGRLGPFLLAQQASITAFEARLVPEIQRASPLLARLGRFCEVTETLPLRAVLVPDPVKGEGGGRAGRGTIVIEVASPDAAVLAFFHHLAHALLLQRRGTIAIAAGKCDEAVDDETLEDALAYAFAPGLVHTGARDVLRELVDTDRPSSLRDPRVRAERLGLAVRTELSGALEGGHETIGAFMPRVCDAWANVTKP